MLLTERRGHVLVVQMSREAKRNAIDAELAAALEVAFDELEDDPELRVGVLSGTATVFSAGNDLRSGSGEPGPRGGTYGLITRRRRTPVIAAVEGPALGGGMELVLACDLVVAATTATFGLPEVTRGVLPVYGGLFRTAWALPPAVAREMVLTGRPLEAERAYALGLVNRLTAPGAALAGAVELAEVIAANAPLAVQESLQVMQAVDRRHDEADRQLTDTARAAVWASADLQEGVAAFGERREPRWTGT